MSNPEELLSTKVLSIGKHIDVLEVFVSNEVVQLLSEQLYRSPLKAIEELVVNAYDAGATECRVFVPQPDDQDRQFIVVFDNGIGMDATGLVNLWQIGRSNKRSDEVEKIAKRKQIGKFGIGKLATYTIANKLTYVTRTLQKILSVTLDFRDFSKKGNHSPVQLSLRQITDWEAFAKEPSFQDSCNAAGIDINTLFRSEAISWTFAILEDLKPKAQMSLGRLKGVLSTAMPLQDDFRLFLNNTPIVRSTESYDPISEHFSLGASCKWKAIKHQTDGS